MSIFLTEAFRYIVFCLSLVFSTSYVSYCSILLLLSVCPLSPSLSLSLFVFFSVSNSHSFSLHSIMLRVSVRVCGEWVMMMCSDASISLQHLGQEAIAQPGVSPRWRYYTQRGSTVPILLSS